MFVASIRHALRAPRTRPGYALMAILTLALGIGAGVVVALALTRLLRTMLFAVSPTDPPVFLGVAALLTAVALFASYVPARKASRADPLSALRHE